MTETSRSFLELGPKINLMSKIRRGYWQLIWLVFYRFTPVSMHRWRCFILRIFGAKIPDRAYPYPSARIWAPWNLEMGKESCLASGVDCYNIAKICIGDRVTISKRSFLCSASHDFEREGSPLIVGNINIEEGVWVAAECFIGPGVLIAENAVVLARSVVTRNIEKKNVVAGNPARLIRLRKNIIK